MFREAVHEVTVGDKEPLRIPKQCKPCQFVHLRVAFFNKIMVFTQETVKYRRFSLTFHDDLIAIQSGSSRATYKSKLLVKIPTLPACVLQPPLQITIQSNRLELAALEVAVSFTKPI